MIFIDGISCAVIYGTHWGIQSGIKESPYPKDLIVFCVRQMFPGLGSVGCEVLLGRVVRISHVTKKGKIVGQRECIYKGKEKHTNMIFVFLEEMVKIEVECVFRLGKWTGTRSGKFLFVLLRSLDFIL